MTRKKTDEQFKQEMKLKHPNILITSEYQGASKKVDCECLIDGHKWSPQATSLQQNHGCPICAIRKKAENQFKSTEQFKQELNIINPFIKLLSDYIGAKETVNVECLICGYEWSPQAGSLVCSDNRGCPCCGYVKVSESMSKRMKGKFVRENNPNWNPNLTDEEREQNRDFKEYEEWRTSVYERDDYTCQCCGQRGDRLNAHHKDGYNWCIERRLDVTNGVTLCKECHKEFHHIYGGKNNTEQQFEEFINNNKRDVI